jgi:hypothetical protein
MVAMAPIMVMVMRVRTHTTRSGAQAGNLLPGRLIDRSAGRGGLAGSR